MIDFHSHIDLYPDPVAVLERCAGTGCYVLAVTTTPLAWHGTRSLVKPYSRVRVGLGLHPELVAERHREVDALVQLLPEARYVGEIGLDGSPRHRGSYARQEVVLTTILSACSALGGRILSIHSRAAEGGVLDALEGHSTAGVPVLHWFSGSRRALDRAVALGCWFSVGPAMLRGMKGRELVAAMPADRVLTETDGPFAQLAGKPLQPWDVASAGGILADLWQLPKEVASARLMANFERLARSGVGGGAGAE